MKRSKSFLAIAMSLALTLSTSAMAASKATTAPKAALPSTELNTLYSSEYPELNYLVSSNGAVKDAYTLLIDGFVQYDMYGRVLPNAAKSWETSSDGLTWTFHLRDGLKWYDNKGNVVSDLTAEDYLSSMQYVLTKANKSRTYTAITDVIVNAKDYYDGKITDFSKVGIKALDSKTVQYKLISPVSYFLGVTTSMAYLPASKKLIEKAGDRFATSTENLYTSGAYYLKKYEPENIREFAYNPKYWGIEDISIATITETYNKEASSIGVEMFTRGETSQTGLPDALLDDWKNNSAKSKYVIPGSPNVNAQQFLFNFAVPNIDAKYNPENWVTAVNNKAFRKAIYHGLDRVAASSTINSYNAKEVISNTISVKNYIFLDGKDYVTLGPLEKLSATEQFDPALAKQFKDQAMKELNGKVKFPVQIVYAYSTGSNVATNMVQVIKQQMEKLLGTDFIVIEPVGYAASGFNTEVRDKGKFCMVDASVGPDAKDPSTLLSMFNDSNTRYGSTFLAKDYKTDGGKAKFEVMISAAMEERLDTAKRYAMFADAEAFLIDEALVIPFTCNRYSFVLTYLQPFKGYAAEKGTPVLKGRVVLPEQLTIDQYNKYKADYEAQKAKISGK